MISVLQSDGNNDIEKGINAAVIVVTFLEKWTYIRSIIKHSTNPIYPYTISILFGQEIDTNIKFTITSGSRYIMIFQVEGLSNNFTRSTPKAGGVDDSRSSTRLTI